MISMVKQISCVTSDWGKRFKALLTKNTCLVNIILLVAKIIPESSFSVIFSCLKLIFQCCYQVLTPCAGAWSASAH